MTSVYTLIWKLRKLYCFLFRPVTLGVKAIVLDQDNRVLMVKHSYLEGWHLPGGGVDRGETALSAVKREIAEEAGIIARSDPIMVAGLYYNTFDFKNDHVALFVVKNWERDDGKRKAGEIIADQFFALDQLPADVSRGNRRRVELYFKHSGQGFEW